jgi:hypothetical protein
MHRRGIGAAGLIGFYQTLRCVFYGFTVRLVGAPFFFACQKPCGSGGAAIRLAREGGLTFDICIECSGLFASKSDRRTAAPTWTSCDT